MQGRIWFGVLIGSTVGGFIPDLWGAGLLSYSSVVLSAVGGFVGLWFVYKMNWRLSVTLAAIRRASSLVSSLATDRRPGRLGVEPWNVGADDLERNLIALVEGRRSFPKADPHTGLPSHLPRKRISRSDAEGVIVGAHARQP
jgi:hypothetical protein